MLFWGSESSLCKFIFFRYVQYMCPTGGATEREKKSADFPNTYLVEFYTSNCYTVPNCKTVLTCKYLVSYKIHWI